MHGRVGLMRLQEHAARLGAATGAARNLDDLLEGALAGAEVAALQRQVGVDDAYQCEVGEMIALRHQLRADQDVDFPAFDRVDQPRLRRPSPAIRSCPTWRA